MRSRLALSVDRVLQEVVEDRPGGGYMPTFTAQRSVPDGGTMPEIANTYNSQAVKV
jgi:hypothetical protein